MPAQKSLPVAHNQMRLRRHCMLPLWRIRVDETYDELGHRIYWEWHDRYGNSSQGNSAVTIGKWVLLRDDFHGVGSAPTTTCCVATEESWEKLEQMAAYYGWRTDEPAVDEDASVPRKAK